MEKVFINPVAKEILVKGTAKEGPVDLFSYDNNGNSRALGNLFVIGNIQGGSAVENKDDIDVGYVLNLVASLAKREYYANPDASPKDAFANALKKINGVVEEFFKNKDTKINIGIFTVAGDQIHISKLGKFKILLAREGKNIDILNNIQLFDKESTQEKEFSNIISGKVVEGDRILAFYPSRSTTAREKYIKDNFLKSSQDEFVAQLTGMKETKPDFACAALHIDILKGTETATAPRVQPKELQETEEEIEQELAETLTPVAQLATTDTEEAKEKEEAPIPVAKTVSTKLPVEPAIPKIIPSEFARGKRELALSKHFRRFKNMNVTPKVKMYAMGGIAVVALIAIFSLKSFVFMSASTKQLNAAISSVQTNLKLAEAKIQQSDLSGAHSLLMSSLATITQSESTNGSSKNADAAKAQVSAALDKLENATDATLAVIADIPTDSGTAKLITSAGANFYVYLQGKDANSLLKIASDGSTASTTPIAGVSPSAMFSSTGYIALVDSTANKLVSVSIAKSALTTTTFQTDPLVNFEVYQDNLYGMTASSIIKITDADLGKNSVATWLASGSSLPANPSAIAVDGNVYVLSSTGVLNTYYKGKQTGQSVNVSVAPETGSLLLTNTSSKNFYLVNMSAGRVYVISKTDGSISKTLKIDSAKAITSATIASDDSIYILSDNKIWSVK